MSGDEMSVLFHDPHDLIDTLEGRTVNACDDGCEAHGVLRRVTQRGEERDVGAGWSSPTIYMVDIVTPETGDLICRTDVRNYDLLEVVPMSIPAPSTDGAPDPEEVVATLNAIFHGDEPACRTACTHVLFEQMTALGLANVVGRRLAGFRVVPEDRPAPLDKFAMQELLDAALQDSWDDYCNDAHSHPPDFRVEGGGGGYTLYAQFGSNFTLYAAERLARKLAAGVPALDEDTRREVERRLAAIQPTTPERCLDTLGKRPGWMSLDQWDPCRCRLPNGHEGDHECSHGTEPNRHPGEPKTETDRHEVRMAENAIVRLFPVLAAAALDDDTRREVEALIERVKGRSVSYEAGRHHGIDLSLNHLDVSLMERMADLLAAAYLGGTDGRA